jgi:multiple sugar transport system substrate-binding protein
MIRILTSAALAAGFLAGAAIGALAGPYDAHKGKTLVVNFPAHPHYNAVMKVLPEFTKETGIKVEVDQLEYLKMREKQTLELTKAKGDYDLLAYVVFSKADYVFADQLENLARFFMNPLLADPSYDAADIIPGYMQNIGVAGGDKGYLSGPTGSLFGIPFGAETSILGYRKDIFEKHKLKVPETYDEMLDLGHGWLGFPCRLRPACSPRLFVASGTTRRACFRQSVEPDHQQRGRHQGRTGTEDHRRLRAGGLQDFRLC